MRYQTFAAFLIATALPAIATTLTADNQGSDLASTDNGFSKVVVVARNPKVTPYEVAEPLEARDDAGYNSDDAEAEDADFEDAGSLERRDDDAGYDDADSENANFEEADLEEADVDDADFDDADYDAEADFEDAVSLERRDEIGDSHNAQDGIEYGDHVAKRDTDEADSDDADFDDADVDEADFDDAYIDEADANDAEADEANFDDADAEEADVADGQVDDFDEAEQGVEYVDKITRRDEDANAFSEYAGDEESNFNDLDGVADFDGAREITARNVDDEADVDDAELEQLEKRHGHGHKKHGGRRRWREKCRFGRWKCGHRHRKNKNNGQQNRQQNPQQNPEGQQTTTPPPATNENNKPQTAQNQPERRRIHARSWRY